MMSSNTPCAWAAWCDRYPNKGKTLGGYTATCYGSHPFIFLNYKESDLAAVFTMAHEGGHAMHFWYSARSNPFMSWRSATFEVEVASTFNEELLFQYLMKNAKDDAMKKYILYTRIKNICMCLYWTTRLAEFSLVAHEKREADQNLTCNLLRSLSRRLMKKYYGSEVIFEKESDMVVLTFDQLYQDAFYIYRYAVGISAAIALAKKVTEGGLAERDAYLLFLKSGGSHYPLENLRAAGVDMETDEPFQTACDTFRSLVDQLDALLF